MGRPGPVRGPGRSTPSAPSSVGPEGGMPWDPCRSRLIHPRPAVRQFGGDGRPHDRVVPGQETKATFGGDGLQAADWLEGVLRLAADEPTHGPFHVDVLGQIGGVKGKDKPTTTGRLVDL